MLSHRQFTMALLLGLAPAVLASGAAAQNQNPISSFLTGLKDIVAPAEPAKKGELAPDHGVQDVACQKGIVDPFDLTDSGAKIIEAAVSSSMPDLLSSMAKMLVGGRADLSDTKASAVKAARATARTMNWLPMSLERQLGVQMHEEQPGLIDRASKTPRLRAAYKTADTMLEKILAAISEPHPYTFQLFVTRGQVGNAQAIPGGYLYLNFGALPTEKEKPKDRQTKERAARFMLAHEIAHVLKRHQTREVQGRVFDTLDTIDKVAKFFDAKNGQPNAQVVLGAAAYLKHLHESYSPDQEKQADACAIRILASIDPLEARHAFASFMDGLPPDPPATDGLSHPKKVERLRHGNAVFMSLGMR